MLPGIIAFKKSSDIRNIGYVTSQQEYGTHLDTEINFIHMLEKLELPFSERISLSPGLFSERPAEEFFWNC